MEGSSSFSVGGDGQGQPPIPQQEIQESAVPQDAAARRRAANRDYSKKYRNKQLSHIKKLEEHEKNLEQAVAEKSLELKFKKETNSNLLAQKEALEEECCQLSAQKDVEEAVEAGLREEKQRLKLIDRVKKLRLKHR